MELPRWIAEIYAAGGAFYVGGRASKVVAGRWVQGRPARVYAAPPETFDDPCPECGYPFALDTSTEKKSKWLLRCPCGSERRVRRPRRLR